MVCGTKGVNKIPEGCWYELVLDALKPRATETDTADGKVWHFHKFERAAGGATRHAHGKKSCCPIGCGATPRRSRARSAP